MDPRQQRCSSPENSLRVVCSQAAPQTYWAGPVCGTLQSVLTGPPGDPEAYIAIPNTSRQTN